ncbi:MAG: diguanylate cyclase domain-containing protein [Acidimicrobiales bacterium]
MSIDDEQLLETLQLARDLCIGIGAFAVTPSGEVRSAQSPVATTPGITGRIQALARACLSHPDARGAEPFWNAEVVPSSESGYDTLACVAVPLHAGGQWLGLLGVVDTWLPELDHEQRVGLLEIAHGLAARMAPSEADVRGSVPPATTEGQEADLETLFPEAAGGGGTAEPPPPGPGEQGTPLTPWPTGPAGPAAPADGPTTPMAAPDSFLGEVADNLPEGLVVARQDGTIIFANGMLADISGWAQDEILGGEVSTLLTADDQPLSFGADRPGETAALLGVDAPGRVQIRSTTGRPVDVDIRGNRFASSVAGDCYVALLRATTHSGLTGAAEAPEAGAASFLLDHLDEGVMACDADGTVVMDNRAARVLQGLAPSDSLVGRPFPAATALRSATGSPLPRTHHPLHRALQGMVVRSEQLQVDGDDGRRHLLVTSSKPIDVAGRPGALMLLRDMTVQLDGEAWLMHTALHDPLTGLANRHLLIDYLRRTIVRFRTRGGPMAVIYLDLDRFGTINEEHGRDAGDELLVAVGRRLQGGLRLNDIVARLGADEFVIAQASPDDTDVDLVVSRIRDTLSAPFEVRGHMVTVTARIGWVSVDPRHEEPSDLIARIDLALGNVVGARGGV